MKSTLRTVHRWISLGVATLWVLQALSGLFLVFHWEIDDALVAGPARPLDLESLVGGSTRSRAAVANAFDRLDLGDRGNTGPIRDTVDDTRDRRVDDPARRRRRATSCASAHPGALGTRAAGSSNSRRFTRRCSRATLGHSLIG